MARRRVGERLRAQARQRRRDAIREQWFPLLVGSLAWAAIVGLLTAWIGWAIGREWAFFVSGAGAGAWFVAGIVIFQHVDPIGSRINAGLDGELYTATELRKLRRYGWRVVHNLHFERGDVDHVAVGPGGVVVLESKSSGSDWTFLEREGVVRRWGRQAHDSAFRVRNLIKSRCGHDVAPVPLVVAWCPGQDVDHAALDRGVVRVRGVALRHYVQSLPEVLDAQAIDEITRVLEAASGDFDQARGISTPGWFRRAIEAGR